MITGVFYIPTKLFYHLLAWCCNPHGFLFFPPLPQLSLRISKHRVQMAVRWADQPMRRLHGGHSTPPSPSQRSATGCSRAPREGVNSPGMTCRECWEPRRKAARVSISCHLLPVPRQTTWDTKGERRLGQFIYSSLRLASSSEDDRNPTQW